VAEDDLQQSLFAATRWWKAGQISMLVPVIETHRTTRSRSEWGGGIGDISIQIRYDFYNSGRSRLVPGIALLAGGTIPSGRSPDQASKPLTTDATGTGSWQGTAGLALEQVFGSWLVTAMGWVTIRSPANIRGIRAYPAPQLSMLAALAYTFSNEAALALVTKYTTESETKFQNGYITDSNRNVFLVSLAGLWPINDNWRLQASLFANPPVNHGGKNSPSQAGVTLGTVYSWM
jgi:hypothetical protein